MTAAANATQHQPIQPAADDQPDLTAFQQTVDDQTAHLDALMARIDFMSSREAELRAMLLDAHDQLVARDDELLKRESLIQALQQQLTAAGEWGASCEESIRKMQEHQQEVAAWTKNLLHDIEQRDATIHDLQGQVRALRSSLPFRLYRLARGLVRRLPR